MTAPAASWSIRDEELDLDTGALVGILNVTPDSFSDGGEYLDPHRAIAHGLELVRQGAAIVDVGGESTRPGATAVPESEELRRLMPVVEGLVGEGVRVSVDTYKPAVAHQALQAGAAVVNDIYGFRDREMIDAVAGSGCGVVAMHMSGTPADMHIDPRYGDVVVEVERFLLDRVDQLMASGVDRSRIAIDPGLGFGKRAHHSLTLLGRLDQLSRHGLPVMIGTSRKGFLAKLIEEDSIEARDQATAVTVAIGCVGGARLFRVHDVVRSRDALGVAGAIVAGQRWDEWLQA